MIRNFFNDGCSLSLYCSDDSVYLYDFKSEDPGKGKFTEFLKVSIDYIKKEYPNHIIYADCNKFGLVVSLKVGGKIVDTFTRIEF